MRIKLPVTARRRTFSKDETLVSKTDLRGRITFVNQAFMVRFRPQPAVAVRNA